MSENRTGQWFVRAKFREAQEEIDRLRRAEPAEPADENQNYAAKYREARVEIDRLTRELAEARELHDAAMTTLLAELGADTSEPRTKWVSAGINNLKHELAEAQAEAAICLQLCRELHNEAVGLKGQAQCMLGENTKLRAAINAMATDAMWIAQIDEGPNTGAWQWILLYETDWHGAYPTPLEAALAGVEKGAQ